MPVFRALLWQWSSHMSRVYISNTCKVTVMELFDGIAALVLLLDIQISKAKLSFWERFALPKEKKTNQRKSFFHPFWFLPHQLWCGDKMAGLALQEPSWHCEARHHRSAMGSTKAEEARGLHDSLSTPGSILGLLFLDFLVTHLSLVILVYEWNIHFTTSEFVLRTLFPLPKSFTFQWNLSSLEAELLWILFTAIFWMLERAQEQDR